MTTDAKHVHGLGESYKRKEDARFIRGQGNYVDDVQLPGMLYGDIVRSPYAHALIKNIDISNALAVPGLCHGEKRAGGAGPAGTVWR